MAPMVAFPNSDLQTITHPAGQIASRSDSSRRIVKLMMCAIRRHGIVADVRFGCCTALATLCAKEPHSK